MHQIIDLKTTTLIFSAGTFCFSLITLYIGSIHGYSGVQFIGAGILTTTISGLLMTFQGIIPSFFSIVIFGATTVMAMSLINYGFRKFLGLNTNVKIHFFIFALALIWSYYFSEIKADYTMRVIFYSMVYLLIFIDNFIILFFKYLPEIKNICRTTGLLFLFLAVIFFIRGCAVIFFPETRANFLMETKAGLQYHYYITILALLISFFSMFSTFICIIFMTTFRLEAGLIYNHGKLKELNAERDKFFSIIAHDLISPLSSIPRLVKIMLDKYDKYSQTEIKENLNDIYITSNKINELLNNLLTWLKASCGRTAFEPEYNNIYEIFQEAVQLNEEAAKNKSIKIINSIAENCLIYCDANITRTIVRNLLSNAVKYSFKNGVIESGDIKTNTQAGFFIKDSGTGINSEKMKCLFKPCKIAARPGTDGEKGNGIGLLIVKEFVDMHKGDIIVESVENKGSKFTVLFPLKLT